MGQLISILDIPAIPQSWQMPIIEPLMPLQFPRIRDLPKCCLMSLVSFVWAHIGHTNELLMWIKSVIIYLARDLTKKYLLFLTFTK